MARRCCAAVFAQNESDRNCAYAVLMKGPRLHLQSVLKAVILYVMRKILLEWSPVLLCAVVFGFLGSSFVGDKIKDVAFNVWDTLYQEQKAQIVAFEDYDPRQDKERWGKRIDEVGPERAREELTSQFDEVSDFRIQHTVAHFFGELLLERFGLEGVQFCVTEYNYGCFHGFMGAAVSSYGNLDAILPKIGAGCASFVSSGKMSVGTACYHGAGHGILEALGYDEDALREALAKCEQMSALFASQYQCSQGVFMEYDFRMLLHAPDIFKSGNSRSLGKDAYEPCSTVVRDEFLPSCYFSRPDWWKTVFNYDYKKIGELCAAIDLEEGRTQCFFGLGKSIVWFTPRLTDKAVSICDMMPKREYDVLCRVGGMRTILLRTGDEALAARLCELNLNDQERESCFAHARLSARQR